jgi:hypothetical protein
MRAILYRYLPICVDLRSKLALNLDYLITIQHKKILDIYSRMDFFTKINFSHTNFKAKFIFYLDCSQNVIVF